jgi:hypothetical protein
MGNSGAEDDAEQQAIKEGSSGPAVTYGEEKRRQSKPAERAQVVGRDRKRIENAGA